jgi:hypothetical protein
MEEIKEISNNKYYIDLGKGEKGIKRLQTATIVIQLFTPIRQQEVKMKDIDEKYQTALDYVGELFDNWTDREFKSVQIIIPALISLIKKGNNIQPDDLIQFTQLLSKSNINLDREEKEA